MRDWIFACLQDCYRSNIFGKLSAEDHGSWYSTLDKGYCGGAGSSACTWRVVAVDKIVKRECHVAVFGAEVAATVRCSALASGPTGPLFPRRACTAASPDAPRACWGGLGGWVAGVSLSLHGWHANTLCHGRGWDRDEAGMGLHCPGLAHPGACPCALG